MAIAYFDRFAIELTLEQAQQGSHQGQCDADITSLRLNPAVDAELMRISAADIAAELKGYGAWDEHELADRETNLNRILWLACGNIVEDECV